MSRWTILLLLVAVVGCLKAGTSLPREQQTSDCLECPAGTPFHSSRCEFSCDAGCLQLACDGGLEVPVIKGIAQ